VARDRDHLRVVPAREGAPCIDGRRVLVSLTYDPPRGSARGERIRARGANRAQLRGETRQVEVGDVVGDFEEVTLVREWRNHRAWSFPAEVRRTSTASA
jgi:hypothetical protein